MTIHSSERGLSAGAAHEWGTTLWQGIVDINLLGVMRGGLVHRAHLATNR